MKLRRSLEGSEMKKTIVAFAGVAVLASWGPAMADLCTDKKNGLATLEAEAPQIRADLAKKEAELESVRREMDKWDELAGGVVLGVVPAWLQLSAKTVGLNPKAYVNIEHDKHADKAGPLRDAISSLKQRQTEVGNQIFLLRDIIGGLGCDTPIPPVDYNAINQLSEQSQQSGPGATPGTSGGTFGGQSVQSQGAYGTPSSGSETPGTPAQTPGSQGYGPGPDESGSPRVPHDQIKVEGSIGGETGGKSATPGETPKPAMEKHKKKSM